MQAQTRFVSSIKLLMFLAFAVLLLLVVKFYRAEHSSQESPTEYEKTQQQAPSRTPTDNQSPTREANVEMPGEIATKFVRAWNQGSSQEVADLFTSDGMLTMPNGSNIQSKSEIAKIIREKRAGPLSETTLSSTIDEVSQTDAKTAVVKGRYRLNGLKILGFNTAATGTFVLRQLRKEGKWLIARAEVNTGENG